MPKRTNDFQKIVAHLEHQLSHKGARVTESKLLIDKRTGSKREVDIVIETKAGIHPFIIGIECIDHKRPASITWLEQISKKHEALPINKTIAVSRSGFVKGAQKAAKDLKIDLYTFGEVLQADWVKMVSTFKTMSVEGFCLPKQVEVAIQYVNGKKLVRIGQDEISQSRLYFANGSNTELRGIIRHFLNDNGFIDYCDDNVGSNVNTILNITLLFENATYILIESAGFRPEVHSIIITAKCRRETVTVNLEPTSYGPAQVAVGMGKIFGKTIVISVIEEKGKKPSINTSFPEGPPLDFSPHLFGQEPELTITYTKTAETGPVTINYGTIKFVGDWIPESDSSTLVNNAKYMIYKIGTDFYAPFSQNRLVNGYRAIGENQSSKD